VLLFDEPKLGCELKMLELLELVVLFEDPEPLTPLDELELLDELVVVEALTVLWSVRFQIMPKSAMEATASVQRALRRVAARPAAWAAAAAARPFATVRPRAAGTARGAGDATPSSAMVTSPCGCATQLST